jgi:hypothetical protein
VPDADAILRQIAAAFAGAPRPERFTDFRHCCECAEHDETLRAHDPETLGLAQLSPAWDPICFATLPAYLYYLPGLARLALGTGADYFLDPFLFHLRGNRVRAFTGAQRRAVLALLRHWAEERLDEVYPSDLDALDRRIAELSALDALAGVPAPVRGLFFALKLALDDPYRTPAGPPRPPADDLRTCPGLDPGRIAAVESGHRIAAYRREGDDYALDVASRVDPAARWRATRHEILAADGDRWRSLGGYLHLDGEPLGDAPLAP